MYLVTAIFEAITEGDWMITAWLIPQQWLLGIKQVVWLIDEGLVHCQGQVELSNKFVGGKGLREGKLLSLLSIFGHVCIQFSIRHVIEISTNWFLSSLVESIEMGPMSIQFVGLSICSLVSYITDTSIHTNQTNFTEYSIRKMKQ